MTTDEFNSFLAEIESAATLEQLSAVGFRLIAAVLSFDDSQKNRGCVAYLRRAAAVSGLPLRTNPYEV